MANWLLELAPGGHVAAAAVAVTAAAETASESEDDDWVVGAILCGIVVLAGCIQVLIVNLIHTTPPEAQRLLDSPDATEFLVNPASRSLTVTSTAVVLRPPLMRLVPIADRVVHRTGTRAVYRQLVRVRQDELPDRWDDQILYYDVTGQLVLIVTALQGSGLFEKLQRSGWPVVDLRDAPWPDLRAPWCLPEPPPRPTDHRLEPPT